MIRKIRVAVAQMQTGLDREQNFSIASDLIKQASSQGAQLVVLPETFNLIGPPPGTQNAAHWKQQHASTKQGKTLEAVAAVAKKHKINVYAGSVLFRELEPGTVCNTSFVFSEQGNIIARYDKIHLARLLAPDGRWIGEQGVSPGTAPSWVVLRMDGIEVKCGMAICYDLRFPELFLYLTQNRETKLICIPSAFYTANGPSHWIPLLRARAIENQVYVIAPNQVADLGNGNTAYGHSVVIDPNGAVLADAGETPNTIIEAKIDLGLVDEVRSQIPVHKQRRAKWTMDWQG